MKTRLWHDGRMLAAALGLAWAMAAGAGAQTLSPLAQNVTAGDSYRLIVSGLPTATNALPVSLYYSVEDASRAKLSNGLLTQSLTPAGGLYFASVTNRVAGLVPDAAAGAIAIDVVAVQDEEIIWSDQAAVTVVPPALTFQPALPALNGGEVLPVVLRRSIAANGSLTVQLTSQAPAVARWGLDAAGPFVTTPLTVTFAPFELIRTVYLSGQGAGVSQLGASVGDYTSSTFANVASVVNVADPDGDGLGAEAEAYLGSDLNDASSLSGDPLVSDGDFDSDGDGLSNAEEWNIYGTDPLRTDSDFDGVDDFTEVMVDITHPLQPMSSSQYIERALDLAAVPGAGLPMPDPARFFTGVGGFTFEAWVRPVTDGDGTLFQLAGTSGASVWIGLEGFRPKAVISKGASTLATVGGVDANGSIQMLDANRWTHLACIWAPERNTFEFYVDGVLLIAKETLAAPEFTAGTATLAAGFSDGFLDEVRFWSRARSWQEVDDGKNRLVPAPTDYLLMPSYGQTLTLNFRFDDGADDLVDFAHLNDAAYVVVGAGAYTTDEQAASLLGCDDEDGDLLPEWWASLHNLEQYGTTDIGPVFTGGFFDDKHPRTPKAAMVLYFRNFVAYGSLGGHVGYVQPPKDDTFYSPVTSVLGADGKYSEFIKYVYLYAAPKLAKLELFTPGMTNAVAYVNGVRVTPEGGENNPLQEVDVASQLKVGRNMIYVYCESEVTKFMDEALTQPGVNTDDTYFERADGKFDARLAVDGVEVIVRGDTSIADPRAVWHGQAWSELWRSNGEFTGRPDLANRYAPYNQDYGLPFDADTDSMNAYYEWLCRTNPRDDDSDNNGVPDGLEDFDGDGLVNTEEQVHGTHPLLPDSDDDGLVDGADVTGDSDPASALSPALSRALHFDGAGFAEFPPARRFALANWTVEAWVRPAASELDGGVVAQRVVGPTGINYELGLGDGVLAPVNTPYVRYISTDGFDVLAVGPAPLAADVWVHLAGAYDASRRELVLYANGAALATAAQAIKSPAIYAGGPVRQRIGFGFDGVVDDVRLWSVARTAAQIAADFETALTGAESGLVAYFRADDATSFQAAGPLVGTSANNGTDGSWAVQPLRNGQVQDFVTAHGTDWWFKWQHAATLQGTAAFTADGDGALYIPPSIRVTLLPPEAVGDGAQWAIQGLGAWRDSGATVYEGMSTGDYTILYKNIEGWTSPANEAVTLAVNGVTITRFATYTRNGSVRVELSFVDEQIHAAQWPVAGAQWRLIGGAWKNSGDTVSNLTPGTYDIEFASLPGWLPPPPQSVSVRSGDTTLMIGQYAPARGSVRVTLTPPEAQVDGASWRLDNGPWQTSGTTLTNLVLGAHTITFSSAGPWLVPEAQPIDLTGPEVVPVAGAYTRATGLYVEIHPPAAVAAGAQWKANEGDYADSGALLPLAEGTYTVRFKPVTGWVAPQDQTVAVSNGWTTALSAGYYAVEQYGPTGSWATITFSQPRGLALDSQRRLYVADSGNDRIVRLDTKDLSVETFGARGTAAGQFYQPFGVTVDAADNLYVADTHNHRVQRRSPAGAWTVYGGTALGTALGQFSSPYDVRVDAAGQLYVADRDNHRVQRRSAAGVWSAVVVNGFADGQTRYPTGLALDASGNLLVADYPSNAGRVQRFPVAGGSEVLGTAAATNGALMKPQKMALGRNGDLYVVDRDRRRVALRTSAGAWSEMLGSNVLSNVEGIAWDPRGYLYVADTGNNRILRVEVDLSANIPPSFTSTVPGPGGVTLAWVGAEGWYYRVEYTDSLAAPVVWTTLPGCGALPGVEGPMQCVDGGPVAPVRTYRITAY